jgi:hypothetical protein
MSDNPTEPTTAAREALVHPPQGGSMSLKVLTDQEILDDIRSFQEAIRVYRAELERRFQDRLESDKGEA